MSDVYDRLVNLMIEMANMEEQEIQPDATFDELEFDSLAIVELIMVVQKEFGVSIDEDDLNGDDTVSRAAEVIEAKGVKSDA